MYSLMKLFPTKTLESRKMMTCVYSLHNYYSISLKNNQQLIDRQLSLLDEYKFHKPSMEKLLSSNVQWNKISPTQLKNTIDVLQSYKFSVNDISDVLKSAPETCCIEKNVLVDTLEAWITCQFSFDRLIDVLSVQPILLKINKLEIPERIPTYLLIFNNNKNKMLLFLKLCPEIMLDNFDAVIQRYNYVRHTMGINPGELLKSRVLCYDINFIKSRHVFLDRSGQFHYRTKNMSPQEVLGNPSLNSIIDTTDEIFASKIGKMNLLEYETFIQYFTEELREEEDSDIDSDDEN